MSGATIIEKMGFELEGKKFKFVCYDPHLVGEEKKLVTSVGMMDLNSGEIVAEVDIPMIEFTNEDEYIVVSKYRKQLIDQYGE